jgi:hypothetical protein
MAAAGGGCWRRVSTGLSNHSLMPMVGRLAKSPRLTELICRDPSGPELEQLLATAAALQPSPVAGVQRLEVQTVLFGLPGAKCGLRALLRSLAHLPSLQVREETRCS